MVYLESQSVGGTVSICLDFTFDLPDGGKGRATHLWRDKVRRIDLKCSIQNHAYRITCVSKRRYSRSCFRR